jgi:quinohemoprotein amine dehydrogenase beta subunit
MKLFNILTITVISFLIVGCSITNQASISENSSDFNYDENRDYLSIVSRTQKLYIMDAKDKKVVKSCNLEGTYGAGAMIMSEDGTKAYVLQDRNQAIYGYDIRTCENFFQGHLTQGNIRGVAVFSLAISKDGKEVYSIYNPARKNIDSYEVLDSVFAVFNTEDGLNAKAVRKFKAPRQTSIMSRAHDGDIYSAGASIYKINPKTGKTTIAAQLRNWTKADHSPPDSLAMWPIGTVSNEFMLMYTAAKFNDKEQSMEKAEFMWGATRIDLTTGEVVQEDFAPIETIMFTGMTHIKDTNLLYGVLTDLTKFDRKNKKVIKRVSLDHTYYCLNFATDGSELYIGGTLNDIVVYDPDTLEKTGNIYLPLGDTGASTLQVFRVKK